MEKQAVLFLGVARPGFNTVLAKELYDKSVSFLEGNGWTVNHTSELLTDPQQAESVAVENKGADSVIIQFCTFVDGRFVSQIMKHFDVPVLLWCLPEPVLGGRLQLNSLTGLNAASCILKKMKKKFNYIYTLPTDVDAQEACVWLRAVGALNRMKSAVICRFGDHPAGFFASGADQLRLFSRLGTRIDSIELDIVIEKAGQIDSARVKERVKTDGAHIKNVDQLVPEQVERTTRITLALEDFIREGKFNAIAMRCWPEFVNRYGAVVCYSLSHLADNGIPSACESDLLGSVSMLIQHYLSGKPTFLGDLVHVDKKKNSSVFWHCGFGPASLASARTGAVAGVQPNRNLGFALNNGLKSGRVTIARLGQTEDDYRMFIASGEALDEANRFNGVSVEVKFEDSVQKIMDKLIMDGYEFHYAIVWEDVVKELKYICSLLDIPVDCFA
jgi:L-fucose isomerase-like protein